MNAPAALTSTLGNGLRVVTTQLPWARRAAVSLTVNVGSRDDSKHKKGISHFAEHLCFRGSAEYPSESELTAQFLAIGAATNAHTDFDSTVFQVGVLPEHLPRALHLLAGMMHRHPLNGFAVERRVVLEELRRYAGPHGLDTEEVWLSPLWDVEHLHGATIGSSETVERLTLEDLRAHFSRFYGARNMVLSIASPGSTEDVLGATAPFSALEAGLPNLRAQTPAARPGAMHHREVNEHHCELRMTFPRAGSSEPIEPALLVLNQVLHGSGHGALFHALRTNRGLIYACSAAHVFFSDFATQLVSLDPNPADPVTPLAVVVGLLGGLKKQPLAPAVLEAAKQGVRLALAERLEDPWFHANFGGTLTLYERKIDHEAMVERVAGVSAAEVQALAHELFKSGNGHITFSGPAKHEKALWKTFKAL